MTYGTIDPGRALGDYYESLPKTVRTEPPPVPCLKNVYMPYRRSENLKKGALVCHRFNYAQTKATVEKALGIEFPDEEGTPLEDRKGAFNSFYEAIKCAGQLKSGECEEGEFKQRLRALVLTEILKALPACGSQEPEVVTQVGQEIAMALCTEDMLSDLVEGSKFTKDCLMPILLEAQSYGFPLSPDHLLFRGDVATVSLITNNASLIELGLTDWDPRTKSVYGVNVLSIIIARNSLTGPTQQPAHDNISNNDLVDQTEDFKHALKHPKAHQLMNAQDELGRTPMHYAAACCNHDTMQQLAAHGSNPKITTKIPNNSREIHKNKREKEVNAFEIFDHVTPRNRHMILRTAVHNHPVNQGELAQHSAISRKPAPEERAPIIDEIMATYQKYLEEHGHPPSPDDPAAPESSSFAISENDSPAPHRHNIQSAAEPGWKDKIIQELDRNTALFVLCLVAAAPLLLMLAIITLPIWALAILIKKAYDKGGDETYPRSPNNHEIADEEAPVREEPQKQLVCEQGIEPSNNENHIQV